MLRLKLRKLLILRNAQNAKSAQKAETGVRSGYAAWQDMIRPVIAGFSVKVTQVAVPSRRRWESHRRQQKRCTLEDDFRTFLTDSVAGPTQFFLLGWNL